MRLRRGWHNPTQAGRRELSLLISDGRIVMLSIPPRLLAGDFVKIQQWLDLMRDAIVEEPGQVDVIKAEVESAPANDT